MYKIGLLNDSFPPTIDGVANAVINYANIIKRDYGDAVVITPKYPHVVDVYPFEVYRYSSAKFRGKLPYRVGNPFSPINVNEIARKKMDLLHVHCPFASAVLARQINMRLLHKRVPVVFTYHTKFDIDIDRFVPNSKINHVARRLVISNINYADDVWVVSEGAGKSLHEFGFQGDYIVMPNGTDFKRGKAKPYQISEIDRIYRLEPGEFVFLFVGRMMWYKNLKIILDSLKLTADAGIKFRAFFVGDGNDRPAVEHYAKTIGIDHLTEFTGAIYDREKIRAFFSRADLFLFPSTYDTSGLVVREAAACDCASLLVKDSCAAEGVEDMVSGLLAEENAESCAKKIIGAAREPDYFKNLGKSAGDNVYVSWEDSIANAWKRYEYVLENKDKIKKHR